MNHHRQVLFAALCTAMLLPVVACSKGSKPPTAPQPGDVDVRSIPSSAGIFLDGAATGTITPNTLAGLTVGNHTLGLRVVGYADTTFSFAPDLDAPKTLTIALRPLSGTPQSFSTWATLDGASESLARGPGGTIYATTYYSFYVLSSSAQILTRTPLPEVTRPGLGLAVDSQGRAYFGHSEWLYVFSSTGATLARLGERGSILEFTHDPESALGRGDTVFVVERWFGIGTEVQRYSGTTYRSSFWVDSMLFHIAIDQVDGTIFAIGSDLSSPTIPSNTVMKFSPGGQLLTRWATAVNGAITVGPDHSVYVAGRDRSTITPDGGGGGRIQQFSSAGVLLREWGVENAVYSASSFEIEGIVVDGAGTIYVTDFNGDRIIRFSP